MHVTKHTFVKSLTFLLAAACGGSSQQAPGANEPEPSAGAASATSEAAPGATAGQLDLGTILAGSHRSAENRARDVYRHPAETLAFFGVQPTHTVIELWPGRGWYTEVLAPLLRERGKLVAAAPTGNYLQPYKDFLKTRPDLYDRVQLVEVTPPQQLSLGPDNSADVVLTFRNLHGWVGNGYAAEVHAAVFRVLKPGGVFGVVDHRAAPGTTAEQTKKSGYTPEDVAIQLATAAGFVLDARSEINANPKDTKDYSEGVWTLPPTLRLGDVDRDKYVAIGESDRFTLRFRKPAQ
jgi:predicted methyltransferase